MKFKNLYFVILAGYSLIGMNVTHTAQYCRKLGEVIHRHQILKQEKAFQQFTQLFAPPAPLQKALDAFHKKSTNGFFLGKEPYDPYKHAPSFGGIPGIWSYKIEQDTIQGFVKDEELKELGTVLRKGDDFNRIINAARSKQCIQINHLDLLDVPPKYIVQLEGVWTVLAKRVEQEQEKKRTLSLALVQQLSTFAEETRFSDWANWMWSKEGKLVCIDTEDASFDLYRGWPCRANYLATLTASECIMEKEALEWFRERKNYLGKSLHGIFPSSLANYNTPFKDIDLAALRKRFAAIQKQYRQISP